MTVYTKQSNKQRGAAMILVIVVTVLLATIGVMFLMVSRLSEMGTAAIAQSRELDAGVDAVVNKIEEVLADSDTGPVNYNLRWLCSLEPILFDDKGTANPSDDDYIWPRITDLWENNFDLPPGSWVDPDNDQDPDQWTADAADYSVGTQNVRAIVTGPKDRTKVILQDATGTPEIADPWDDAAQTHLFGARADADGDGVADSRWIQIPGLTTGKGKPVYAAVRIIDNAAMLNLNTATCFDVRSYADADKVSPFAEVWNYWDEDPLNTFTLKPLYDTQTGAGRFLTEINYLPFLRGHDLNGDYFDGSGGDFWYNLMIAKGLAKESGTDDYTFEPQASHDVLMNIENPGVDYHFFDLADELELRNRYLVTSPVEARFEQEGIAHFSLDADSGAYAALEVPRDVTSFDIWKYRIDPTQFHKWDAAGDLRTTADPLSPYFYRYDRRHVCTFYSFDRVLQKGNYSLLLRPELETLATSLGWSDAEKQKIEKVFRPTGAVTVNIETPLAEDTWGNSVPYNNIETRRKILHLLYAFREYYFAKSGDLNDAASKAAQIVANIIDYSDDDSGNTPLLGETEGPFYDSLYLEQANVDCTFLTEAIIEDMIDEVSDGLIPAGTMDFGLTETVFGYERQAFISEVYAKWNGAPAVGNPVLEAFAIEIVNPYDTAIELAGWRLKIGSTVNRLFSPFDTVSLPPNSRLVFRSNVDLGLGNTVPVAGATSVTMNEFSLLESIYPSGDFTIQLLRPAPVNSGFSGMYVDCVSSDNVLSVLGTDGRYSLQRDDDDWKFIYGKYAPVISIVGPYILGVENSASITDTGFQLAVPDNGLALSRWHELETLGLHGNMADSGDPNQFDPNEVMTKRIADDTANACFNLEADVSVLNYVCTMNRPDMGTLPGRININTAPVHVIAAAIPPALADPNALDSTETVALSALDMAQRIVSYRRMYGPFNTLGDLLKVSGFTQYTTGGTWDTINVGQQSIDNDIEERHWVLSNLANKFTVRSDVFTAYLLVRLGEDGPQRRMIAIFDRSNVWQPGDRPKLVALHPVPDPR